MSRSRFFITITTVLAAATVGALADSARAQVCTPSRLTVILDKSSSMETGDINGQTKWSIAVDALDQLATAYEDSIALGLMMFPEPNECSPGSLNVTPALYNRSEILAELGSPPPTGGNWTPMAQTLEAAATEPAITAPGSPKYAVLITDGWQWCSPYDPATRFDPVDAVADLSGAGVKTYVVGFGGSVDALTLNQVAVTAGTARPGCNPNGDDPGDPNPCYYQADSPGELLDALTEVALDASTEICDGEDNDCDGQIDENLVQACSTQCGSGVETCQNGSWSGCSAQDPEAEVCDGEDNDCDGTTDPGCNCTPGDTRSCGEETSTGACEPGTQTCLSNGTWSGCEGSAGPGSEMCDGEDNDCDGFVDEASGSGSGPGENDDDVALDLCGPGMICEGGSCDPVDPQDPTPDDGPSDNPADGEGGLHAGMCACDAGAGPGSAAGTGLLLLLAASALRRRRRVS